jgi:DNA-binding response OmpR family regulator
MQKTHKLSQVPVIACTAVGDNAVVKEILKYGVKNYIKKPIQPDAVIERIRDVMDKTAPTQEE